MLSGKLRFFLSLKNFLPSFLNGSLQEEDADESSPAEHFAQR